MLKNTHSTRTHTHTHTHIHTHAHAHILYLLISLSLSLSHTQVRGLWDRLGPMLEDADLTEGTILSPSPPGAAATALHACTIRVHGRQRAMNRYNCADSLDRTNLCCFMVHTYTQTHTHTHSLSLSLFSLSLSHSLALSLSPSRVLQLH